jgi:hypothetical protein
VKIVILYNVPYKKSFILADLAVNKVNAVFFLRKLRSLMIGASETATVLKLLSKSKT